ncbi:peptidoglycan-binding domain-containing protein [Streptomyces sp. NPDC000151]|uniref:peptidoglycan-binding domain-containing protein n=1 Tax=Streptomyces sp. NPDC000151 TaxID=3154244 RepID=UPI0033175F57
MDTGRESESRADGRRAGRRRRGPVLVGTGILLVAGVSTVGALGLGGGGADADQSGQSRSSQAVRVTRGTLTDQTEIDGRLGHGPEVPFPVKAKGTVTWLPETDRTIRRGGTVLRVDDRPVVLLYGSLPMYRDLGMVEPPEAGTAGSGAGSEDTDEAKGIGGTKGIGGIKGTDGADDIDGGTPPSQQPAPSAQPTPLRGMDVKQFETNLQALGYSGFTVDDTYTTLTADAVKRWQKDLGLPQTGKVGAGDIVYASGPVRIAGTSVRVGAEAAGSPVSYTRTSRMVTVAAPAADTDWARRGSEVTVELPDGRSVQGKVASVGKDASASGAGGEGGADGGGGEDGGGDAGSKAATVSVVITFDDQDALGRMESGPVTVRYVVEQRKGVLTVPVAALVALAEGGHGVELAEGSGGGGADRFVPVKTGLFANGRVEVSGPQVHEGMKVRIPK